jgi:hypothetical protein
VTGVYARALGDAAADLHPRVRDRYALEADDAVCVGRGRMDISRGTHVLPALAAMPAFEMLFPEAGKNVPFAVYTQGTTVEGHDALATVRAFDFGTRTRRFSTLTVWDGEEKRLLDFLGRGGHLVTELHPTVEAGALVVRAGRQWARAAGRARELPGALAADLEVRDRYDPADERFHVDAVVENPLAGHVLSYRGAFTQTREDAAGRDFRPVGSVEPLPR